MRTRTGLSAAGATALALIAATALTHGLTMVTRNRVDFAKANLLIVDPYVDS